MLFQIKSTVMDHCEVQNILPFCQIHSKYGLLYRCKDKHLLSSSQKKYYSIHMKKKKKKLSLSGCYQSDTAIWRINPFQNPYPWITRGIKGSFKWGLFTVLSEDQIDTTPRVKIISCYLTRQQCSLQYDCTNSTHDLKTTSPLSSGTCWH